MGSLDAERDYENLRNARISQNQARLASLRLEKSVSELRAIISSTKPVKTPRKNNKTIYCFTSLRRSNRLKEIHQLSESNTLRRSKRKSINPISSSQERFSFWEPIRRKLPSSNRGGKEKRAANAPILNVEQASKWRVSPDVLARRCNSKSRGSVYDPVFGICCHFCRQKKLCGEEDCKRCGDLDMDQPCMGKTDCSVCHSSTGVLCRACLKVRYGEEMEEVRKNKEWMCPHCVEDKGINPYWICNSSLCMKKRKMLPTGIAIFQAREMGYKSVAHMLMNKLQQAAQHG